jgi:hypothetical protein
MPFMILGNGNEGGKSLYASEIMGKFAVKRQKESI